MWSEAKVLVFQSVSCYMSAMQFTDHLQNSPLRKAAVQLLCCCEDSQHDDKQTSSSSFCCRVHYSWTDTRPTLWRRWPPHCTHTLPLTPLLHISHTFPRSPVHIIARTVNTHCRHINTYLISKELSLWPPVASRTQYLHNLQSKKRYSYGSDWLLLSCHSISEDLHVCDVFNAFPSQIHLFIITQHENRAEADLKLIYGSLWLEAPSGVFELTRDCLCVWGWTRNRYRC